MTKKEKLEYFKLVEPKLREKMLKSELEDSDFERLNIKGKDIDLFKKIYQEIWLSTMVNELAFNNEEFMPFFEETSFTLDFPDDKYFYQFGVANIDIEMFKYYLESKCRLLFINRLTGGIEQQNSPELIGFPDEKDFKNKISLIIDNPITFLQQLKNGEIDKILTNEKKNPNKWEVPLSHSMNGVVQSINIDDFIDVLGDNKQWITYDINFDSYTSYQDFNTLKINMELIFNSNEPNTYCQKDRRFFFKVNDPLKMRFELINGNMEILNEIKEIKFCSVF